MAKEDEPQQGQQPSGAQTPASSEPEPKHAAHMANSPAPHTFVMGSSSDPDSTMVYVQAAAQSRKRAAHMDRQKGIELEVNSMMDEINGMAPHTAESETGDTPALSSATAPTSSDAAQKVQPQTAEQDADHAHKPRRVRFAHHKHGGNGQQPSTPGAEQQAQQPSNASAQRSAGGQAGAQQGPAQPEPAQPAPTQQVPAAASSASAAPHDASSQASAGSGPVAVGSFSANNSSYEPATAANPYDDGKAAKSGKHKHHVGLAITCVVVAVLAGIAAFGLWYLHDINSRLNSNLDTNLTSELAQTPPGDPFYLLLLGTDKDEARAEGTEYGDSDSAYRSDSIMLVRVDPKNVKVTLVSIHRDTMVDLGEHGTQKINAAYSIGGPSYATEVISNFAGVDISHYAEVDMDRFADIVDQVGGVTVNLPIAVKDPNYTGLDLDAGEQTLDGHTAALLCRARHAYDAYGDGDRYRAANQRIVMSAVVKKVLASDPATMASTITTMADSVTTDMTLTEILTLASQMKSLNVNTDVMSGMEPTTSEYINQTWYEIVNEDEWKTMMDRVDQGLSPTEDSSDDEMTANVAADLGDDGSDGNSGSSDGGNASDSNTEVASTSTGKGSASSEESDSGN